MNIKRCRDCIYHHLDFDGHYKCALGEKRDPHGDCPKWHKPRKRCLYFRYDGFAFKVVEVEYWNSVMEEINFGAWINIYSLPYAEMDRERTPDYCIRFQSAQERTDNELRKDAMNLYTDLLKDEIDKKIASA